MQKATWAGLFVGAFLQGCSGSQGPPGETELLSAAQNFANPRGMAVVEARALKCQSGLNSSKREVQICDVCVTAITKGNSSFSGAPTRYYLAADHPIWNVELGRAVSFDHPDIESTKTGVWVFLGEPRRIFTHQVLVEGEMSSPDHSAGEFSAKLYGVVGYIAGSDDPALIAKLQVPTVEGPIVGEVGSCRDVRPM